MRKADFAIPLTSPLLNSAAGAFGAEMPKAEPIGISGKPFEGPQMSKALFDCHAARIAIRSVFSSFIATHLDDSSAGYETFVHPKRVGRDGLPSLNVGFPAAT
jgi:hypothetical protein